MKRRKGKASYKFTEKTHSKKAILSVTIAGISLCMYLIFIYLSYKAAGNLSAYYGSFGVLAMILAMGALGISFTTLKEEDSLALFPKLAIGTSGLAVLCWLGTYIFGFMRG